MSAFFLVFACINLTLAVLCIKEDALVGAVVSAFGFAWCLANLLGWV